MATQAIDLSAGLVPAPSQDQNIDLSAGLVQNDQQQFAPPPGTPDINSSVAKPNLHLPEAGGVERFATALGAGTGDLLNSALAVRGENTPDSFNPDAESEAYYKRTGDWKGAVLMAQQNRQAAEPGITQSAKDTAEGLVEPVKSVAERAKYDVPGALGEAIPLAATMVAGKGEAENLTAARRASFVENRIAKLIKPMTGDLRYGADPAGAIAREGITYNSLEDLGDKVYARARDVGQTIDQILQSGDNPSKVVNVRDAVNGPIDEMMRKAVENGDSKLYDNLQNLREQVNHTWTEVTDPKTGKTSLQISGTRDLTHMSPMEATQLKRAIADMTRFDVNDVTSNEVNGVKAAMFGRIKDAVNQTVPEVAQWNQRYADLVNAGKAIERRNPVAARNASFSLGDMAAGGLGMAVGHSPAGVALAAAHKVARSPSFVSRVSDALYPDALRYEDPAAARAKLDFKLQPPPGRVPPATQEHLPFNEGFSQDMQTGPNSNMELTPPPGDAGPAQQRPLNFHESPSAVYPSTSPGGEANNVPPPEPKQLKAGRPFDMGPSSTPERKLLTSGNSGGNPARDTAVLHQVQVDHPDWNLSKQLQEAAKRAQPERRITARNGHTFTEAERQKFLARQREVDRGLNPNPNVRNPFDSHPSHMDAVRKDAVDVLSGKSRKTHIR